jgi:carbon-monoxide dehydrogenase medium subunit
LQGPGRTVLAPGELLAGVTIPLPPAGSGMAFEKQGRRKALACSVVNAAALLAVEDGCIHRARLALGAVAPVVVRCRASEECLRGQRFGGAVLDEAAQAVVQSIHPISDVRASAEYRRAVSVPLARRCLLRAWQAADGWHGSRVGAIHELPPRIHGRPAYQPYRITLTVNSQLYDIVAGGATTLLELLRDQLGLTGTKDGCGEGDCGACTVIVDGQAVKSCLVLAAQAHGSRITTVEGLSAPDGSLHPLQIAFAEAGAVQCGYCTPGMLMAARALLDAHPQPTPADVRAALSGNLCRCTGYAKIVAAVQEAARRMEK